MKTNPRGYWERPSGYWQNEKNIEKEMNKLKYTLGHTPTRKELISNGYAYLANLLSQNKKLAKKLDYKTKQFTKWEYENSSEVIQTLTLELGHKPILIEILNNGYKGLYNRMYEDKEFAKKLGYKVRRSNRKPPNYWNLDNVKFEMEKVIQKIGHYPRQDELEQLGHKNLVSAISKRHGGYSYVRKLLGYDVKEKPKHYWEDIRNVKKEMKNVIEKLGHYPTQKELNETTPGLAQALNRHHGGLLKLAKEMGYKTKMKPKNYWDNPKNVKKEILGKIQVLGHFPTRKELEKLKASSLAVAIIKTYGSFPEARKSFGFSTKIKNRGYWQNWENYKKEIIPIIDDFLSRYGRLPKVSELVKYNNSFQFAALNYYGGINSVYAKLGYLAQPSEKGIIDYVSNSHVAKIIIEKFGNDSTTIADIFSVINEGRTNKNQIIKLLESPSLKDWLGHYKKGINSIQDLAELEITLPIDKNGIIDNILRNAALDFMRKSLGTKPTEEEKEKFLQKLQESLYAF